MKNKIALALLCTLVTACQEYSENPNGNDRGKACNFATYSSTIAVQVSGNIPDRLVGTVNGMAVINECTLGTDNDSYTTVRTSNAVTILLKVGKNAAMSDMFFDDNGRPKSTQFQFILRGSSGCPANGVTVFQTTRNLSWQPVYSNSNSSCGPSGYTATVSN